MYKSNGHKKGSILKSVEAALRAQGRENDAETVQEEFGEAWGKADMEPAVAFAQKIDSSVTAP